MIQYLRKHSIWFLGFILTAASLYSFSVGIPKDEEFLGTFFLNYLFVFFYFIVLLVNGRLKRGAGLGAIFMLLTLGLISCYSLNREMTIFEQATGWWVVVLVICCANYLAIPFFDHLPKWCRHLVVGLAGLSTIVFLYLLCYLFPIYIFGALGAPFLGISLHAFVPLLFFIYTIVFIRRVAEKDRRLYFTYWASVGVITLIIIGFISRWLEVTRTINHAYHARNRDLPAWVNAAQASPEGSITEKVLKSEIVYSVSDGRWNFFDMPSRNFGENKKHDPLVILSTMLTGVIDVPQEDRIKMLQAIYDSRHQAQERLWLGDYLQTTKVQTSVEIWPHQHLSYTEKEITIWNDREHNYWKDQEEAIYTFHLPEGAVVSSLSLWINGKEEKGVLTSKGKADSAYKSIVSVQRRDPSVVHWQEGNTVSVRVFPVIAGESRCFKIGITAPLKKNGDMLEYRNIYFDGPSANNADELIAVRSDLAMKDIALPYFLIPGAGGKEGSSAGTKYEGKYTSDWGFSFRDEGTGKEVFDFGGKQYTLAPYFPQRERFACRAIFLDLNRNWHRGEFDKILEWTKVKPVYVFQPNGEMVQVTEKNASTLYEGLTHASFSLFPFHRLPYPEESLVISRSGAASPNIGEIDTSSHFSAGLKEYLQKGQKARVFSLGDLSPYLKTLKDYHAIRHDHGEMEALQAVIEQSVFRGEDKDPDHCTIDEAEIMISRVDSAKSLSSAMTSEARAPDHLLRLFAYNDIMRQALRVDTIDEGLVKEAQFAHIVTPLSSLIVLETRADYESFNIKDSKDGLKNASLHSKGAVPEPGEWAMIFLVAGVLIWVYGRHHFKMRRA